MASQTAVLMTISDDVHLAATHALLERVIACRDNAIETSDHPDPKICTYWISQGRKAGKARKDLIASWAVGSINGLTVEVK